jgi:superfamily II DNA or RNA helicase
MKQLTTLVLKWNGLSAAFTDGKTPNNTQTEIIEAFNQPGSHIAENGPLTNILFIMNVATTGINLPCGMIVIMLVSSF